MQSQARVLIAERDPIYRIGLAQVLRVADDIALVGECDDADDALALCQSLSPDIVILAGGCSDGGVAAVRALRHAHPWLRVIVLERDEDAERVEEVLGSGAQAYLSKSVTGPALVDCIRAVAQGNTVVSPAFSARMIQDAGHSERIETLTDRERQVLASVGRGFTNKEVARELELSEKTVKQYMSNIMDKLQVRNRVEAVIVARRIKPGA
jgi:two-component system nitrate/nitrite response regulator NarL